MTDVTKIGVDNLMHSLDFNRSLVHQECKGIDAPIDCESTMLISIVCEFFAKAISQVPKEHQDKILTDIIPLYIDNYRND